jgi:L-iditol 2-dehydrogenase
MKIAHFTALRHLEISETAEPKRTRPDEVLLRIDRVGVCGSDVHYYTEGRIGQQIVQYPATVGHECSGTVVEVGPAVRRVAPGDRVAVDPALSCGRCDQCLSARPNTCRNLQFMGNPGQAPGVVCEYRLVPAANCYPIPRSMTLDQAALVEPLSIGMHAVRLAAVRPASRIAILGCGPIGLSVLLCAKMTADCTVCATDLIDHRLGVARGCGADWTGNPKDANVVAAIQEREPLGLDLVFECSGDPACLDQAMELLGPGGKVLLVGIPPQVRVDFDAHVMRYNELGFQAVRRQCECVAPVIEAIGDGRIDTSTLVTHRFPLAQIRDAFELVAGYRDGVIKAMIDVSSGAL